MKKLRGISLLSLVLLCHAYACAQISGSNLRRKTVPVADSLQLDSLSIIPSSFRAEGLDSSAYFLDFINAKLYLRSRPPADSITLQWRVFPYKLNAVTKRLSYDSVINNVYYKPYVFDDGSRSANAGLLDFGNLEANGSIGREFSFGNNQDAVINSNLQLQISGMLKDSIRIQAALSDNNLPIQPDGTTQQLNDFDQVYLRFSKRNWQLDLGDLDLRQNDLYFLNFYKRLRGLSFQTTQQLGANTRSSTLASGSIAKGKFTRNVFQGLEGNQGPYRLTGANNEYFFVVLGNTERVFLDGELLKRGEDQDYIINYNTAEVTFMPRRMITKDSRIQIEFEYADRNYLNANLYVNQQLEFGKKLKINIGAFNNSDAKNSQINQVLDNQQKQFLFNVGDSIKQALYPTAYLDSFSADRILYEQAFDTIGSLIIPYYRYSVNPQTARYNVAYSDVGIGNGNYVPDFNGANGKVYRYVSPVNGVKQGQYEPVTLLVTPKKQQLISMGTDYQMNVDNKLHTEFAMSNYDVNTFSSKDGGDDIGLAARVQYFNTTHFNRTRGVKLNSAVDYEYVQSKFKPLERLRYVEFTREWGLPLVLEQATEKIFRASTQLENKTGSLSYQFMTYQRSDDYKGFQHLIQHKLNTSKWQLNNQYSITNFDGAGGKGFYLRPVIDASRQVKAFGTSRLGVRYALEHNEIRFAQQNDSLSALSFAFDTWTAYLRMGEQRKNKYALNFFTRADKLPFQKNLYKADRSYNLNAEAQIMSNEKRQLILSSTYRILEVNNSMISKQKEDHTLLGRSEYVMNEWNGLVTGNVLYELGTGQEQRRDFAYFEVPAGQGEYTWNDYNGDGVQQINEFEVARFQDQARFIRIYTPTNNYIKANYVTLNYSFSLNPRAVLNGKEMNKLSKFIARFNAQSSMQRTRKSLAADSYNFNPFAYNVQDTGLITLNTSLLNSLSFNRFVYKWGVDLSNVQNTGKSLLTYGYESRKTVDWVLKTRWGISSSISSDLTLKTGLNGLYTPGFANRNYELDIQAAEPRISFIQGTVFRVQTGYKWERRRNDEQYGGEEALSNSINLESKYNILQNASLGVRFTYDRIQYDYPQNTTVSYIMLDGLVPGKNFLWGVDFTKRIFGNVEMNLQYEGRKPGDTRVINTGRASLRALF